MGDRPSEHKTQLPHQQKPPVKCRQTEQTGVRPQAQNQRRVGGVPQHEGGRAKAESKTREYLKRHPRKTKTNRRLGVQAETAKVKEKPGTRTVFKT